jgi:hypothetical protein
VRSNFWPAEPLLRLDLLESKLSTERGRGRVSIWLTSDMVGIAQMEDENGSTQVQEILDGSRGSDGERHCDFVVIEGVWVLII